VIVGLAVLPAAPVLVPGVSATLPDALATVARHVRAVLAALPAADAAILLAAAPAPAVHDVVEVSLAGIGRPDVVRPVEAGGALLAPVTASAQYPLVQHAPLPVDLTVLALHAPPGTPLVPVAVPATAAFEALVGVGAGVARAVLDTDRRTVVLVAGDLSAGLSERAPLYRVDGAQGWDERAVAVVDSGRLDGLARLGPDEARRVGARGWAPLAALHGLAARAKTGIVLRHYSAPRGVGYLVAAGG
jgi:hypothetical protein